MQRKINFRVTIIVFILSIYYLQSFATKYYVDNTNGNDTYNGLSAATAWQSLTKVNASTYSPGDSILFIRGGILRGQLLPKSGTAAGYITYADYGSGAKPLLLGSVNVSNTGDWISEGSNIWHSAQSSTVDIGNLIFNGAASFGVKKWTASQLLTQGDYWWDKTGTKTVKIYSATNPATYYSDIKAAIGTFIIYIQQGSYIVLKNLALKYGSADGIEVRNTHHTIISDCELSYIGGCELTTQVRYGGGIQFWANSNNNTVERCKFWEIYDDAVTNQGNASAGNTVQQYNLYYRNNIILNCSESSFCFYIQPAVVSGSFMKNIYFENNTCVNAGGGWAASPRPDLKGFQVYCSENTATTDSIFIRNNIFYKSRCVLFFDNTSVPTLSHTTTDYNCWFTQNSSDTIVAFWTSSTLTVWKATQFANYQTSNSQDIHSFMADPLFVDAGNNDYHLAAGSPCINTGTNTGITDDFDLNPRPQNGLYDMGAYEAIIVTPGIVELTHDFDRLNIYPNPCYGLLTIAGAKKNTEIRIYSTFGEIIFRTIIENKQQTIDLSNLANGVYFVCSTNANGEINSRKTVVLK